jgi:hypothetical protein
VKKFFRLLYLAMPKPVRVWSNSVKAAWTLRKLGKGRIVTGQLGIKIYRGLGAAAAEKAGLTVEQFNLLPAVAKNYWSEEAKRDMTPERIHDEPNTVTDAGVAFLVDDWDNNAQDITTMNYHEMGTGGTPPGTPAVTATALVTPVESRSAGTKSQPAANQIRTIATITATAARTINEWGLFSAAAAGTMWSSRWFTAITLASGDAIEFTYSLTISSFTA